MVLLSKACVCGHLIAGLAESNPTEGMNVRLLCLCYVVTGLRDGLITHSE